MEYRAIKILNPKTNRKINYGTPLYAKLVREGVIEPYVAKNEFKAVGEHSQAKQNEFKEKLSDQCTDLVRDNRDQFGSHLTQEQTDALLKRMLYEKLCLNPKDSSQKSKVKSQKSKRSKWKVKKPTPPTPPSSSSESDLSESDSD